MTRHQSLKQRFIARAAALLLSHRDTHEYISNNDLQKHDFPASTQRLGIRFTDSLRDFFRRRWIRKTR